jgi:hypothetical protein
VAPSLPTPIDAVRSTGNSAGVGDKMSDISQESWFGKIFILPLVSAPAIVGWQTFEWLRDGVWTDLNLAGGLAQAGLPVPQSSWLGIQKILDWFLSLPLAVSLGAISFAWYACGMLLALALIPAERK